MLRFKKPYLFTIALLCFFYAAQAQKSRNYLIGSDADITDIAIDLIKKDKAKLRDTVEPKSSKLRISAVPAAGYTLQTGFAALVSANAGFHTSPNAKISSMLTSFTYTTSNQVLFPFQASIWTKNNKYNFIGDWRYLYFPSFTYGLGGYTKLSDGYIINYSSIRLHQTVLRKVRENMYAGIGYNLDYFWNVKELNLAAGMVTDFQKYEKMPNSIINNTQTQSGITFNFLYDSRENSINAEGGEFINVIYRPNLALFGNNNTCKALVIDLRKYIRLSKRSENVLAFWTYEWLTVNGTPPYLMLPNTGSDPYSNTGRGYIQGRYRGANMLYAEGEYRFKIAPSGLIGGVIFANAESFTETGSGKFETIAPAAGAGVRLKLNKYSRTNLAIDYGIGIGGSHGVSVNLGEVF